MKLVIKIILIVQRKNFYVEVELLMNLMFVCDVKYSPYNIGGKKKKWFIMKGFNFSFRLDSLIFNDVEM